MDSVPSGGGDGTGVECFSVTDVISNVDPRAVIGAGTGRTKRRRPAPMLTPWFTESESFSMNRDGYRAGGA